MIGWVRRSSKTWLRAAALDAVRQSVRKGQLREQWDVLLVMPLLGSLGFALALALGCLAAAATLTALGGRPPTVMPGTLAVLWQVQSALLGLAVAVSIFAYQSLGTAMGSRRRLILLTGHPASIVIGVSLAFLTGAAFIGSSQDFGRWLGTIAIGLTAAWLVLLVLTLAQAPHLQDQRFAISMRRRVLHRNAALSVRDQLVERASSQIIATRLRLAGGEYAPWILDSSGPYLVRGTKSGSVVDVSMPGVEKAARIVSQAGGKLQVAVHLGQRIEAGLPIAAAGIPVSGEAERLIQRALVYGSQRTHSLDDDLIDLHSDALRSLEASPDILDDILAAYYGVLEDYAVAWLAFTESVESKNLPAWPEAARPPTAQIRDSLLRLYQRSLEGRFRDAAFSLVYFPIGVVQRAVGWHAPGYFDFVDLYTTFYSLANQAAVPEDMQRIFKERAWWHPVEARELILPAIAKHASKEEELLVGRAVRQIDSTVLGVLRACIRSADFENFREGLRRWRIASR